MQADKKGRVRLIAIAAAIFTVAAIAVGTTVAYLQAQTPPIENTLEPVYVSCEVNESFDRVTKSNVTVTNTGDIDAYIRAAIIVNWVDASGNIHRETPIAGVDYSITLGSDKWLLDADGLCYYSSAVAPESATEVLISSLTALTGNSAPEGYSLQVQIMASAIQAEPAEAVETAWGVTVDENGSISVTQ